MTVSCACLFSGPSTYTNVHLNTHLAGGIPSIHDEVMWVRQPLAVKASNLLHVVGEVN